MNHFRSGLAKLGIVSRNGQVTHHVQNVTTTNRITGDGCDNWLRAGTDLALEVEHVQVVCAFVILVTAVIAANFLVTA